MTRAKMITSLGLCMLFNVAEVVMSHGTLFWALHGLTLAWAAMFLADWIHS